MMRALSWVQVCCAVCVLAVAVGTAQGAITDELFAYWDMNGDLEDVGNPTYNGTLASTGGSTEDFITGKFGQAIDLDSSDDQRVEITGDTGGLTSPFRFQEQSISISGWFTVEAFDQSWQGLVAKGEGDSWRVARRSGGNVMAYAGGSGDTGDVGPDVSDGGWHHIVAITEHNVSTRIWVDGALVDTGGAPTIGNDNLDRGLNPMMIGGNPDTAGDNFRSWNGAIDDVAIWTRPLSDNEVGHLWNGGAGNAVIPEPTSMTLVGLGLLALGVSRRRRRK